MNTISVEELKKEIEAEKPLVLLDVREPGEFEICRIAGSQLIPLGQLPARFSELDPKADTVVICRVGGRSGLACEFLEGQGFRRVRNLIGGVVAWAERIDPSMPKY